ncbi:MAG: hypothetical protein AAF389_03225 [Gemmatimonadota bacterium]
MRRASFVLGCLAAGSIALAPASAAAQQEVDFTQVTRPVVQVTDSASMDFLLYELFFLPLEPPTRMQVIDVTQNGFGPDDVMIVYPSVEVFVIPEFIPDTVQTVMSGWVPSVEYRMDSGNMSAEALASLIGSESDSQRQAEGALLYDLVEAIERSYRDLPFSMLFERDSIGFTFQLWDYNRPSMTYTPRPEFVPDSSVAAVLDMLREVGYVPGQNAIGTGLSLEARGDGVVTVDRALLGMTRLPSEQMRLLAARTVLLGSYDYDRSGEIDQATEIDGPGCAVWVALNDAFPDFLTNFGFAGDGQPYVGNIVLEIGSNVREAAYRRGSACLRGEVPVATDPATIGPPESTSELPENVERFVRLEAAGEILQQAGQLGTSAEDWYTAVRQILGNRFDRDGSGQLDLVVEIRAIPCDVWQAMAATHPEFPYGLGFLAGDVYVGDRLGVAPSQRQETLARANECVQTSTRTADTEMVGPAISEDLQQFLDLLTASRIARSAEGMQPGSVRWATLVESTLLNHYDLDASGALDQTDEILEVPCAVWGTIEATYGESLAELGLGGAGDYFADQIGIDGGQRELATARVTACREEAAN